MPYTLVTGIPLPDQFIDNVLATPQSVLYSEKFERFEAVFSGAGDTLCAALAALLANGHDLQAATAEALTYLDHSLDGRLSSGHGQHRARPHVLGAGDVDDDDGDWGQTTRRQRRRGRPPLFSICRPTAPPNTDLAPSWFNRRHKASRNEHLLSAPKDHPRRRQLAGARLQGGGWHAAFRAARANGAYFWDADGKRYIDYIGSWGPMILGHGHPAVVDAVQKALLEGFSFGAPTEREVELAEEIIKLVPSIEMVRLVSSGTEAAMSAIRLARGATGRSKIIKFEGCYHGHADALAGQGRFGSGHVRQPHQRRRSA